MDVALEQTPSAGPTWLRRARFFLAVALVWAGLHFVVDRVAPWRGLDRPAVLTTGSHGWLLAPLAAVVLLATAAVGTRIAGRSDGYESLVIAGLGLVLWAAMGGTVDQWIIMQNPRPGVSSSLPYWLLIPDYVLLALLAGAIAVVGATIGGRESGAAGGLRGRLRRVFVPDRTAEPWRDGLLALLTTSVVAALLLTVINLNGPAQGWTRHGQVYFATGAAFAAGVFVAARVVKLRQGVWFWPAPILVGLVGAIVAAIRPDLALPPDYHNLGALPAWGLVRALPVEMVGVGLVATLLTLRAVSGPAAPAGEPS